MNLRNFVQCLSVLQLIVVSAVFGADPPWSYDQNAPNGPQNWGSLPGYQACDGNSQSPINIDVQSTTKLSKNLKFYNYDKYTAKSVLLENDGHTIDISFTFSSESLSNRPYITGGGLSGDYKLMVAHFHWGANSNRGSEHTIDNHIYPMEVHLVHIKSTYKTIAIAREHADGIAVIGSMYNISRTDNNYMKKLLTSIQTVKYKEQNTTIDVFSLYDLLPANYEYFYAYHGSLTTPPCSESVSWIVFDNEAQISENQMKVFRNLQKETKENDPNDDQPLVDNFRAIQPLNRRTVYWRKQF